MSEVNYSLEDCGDYVLLVISGWFTADPLTDLLGSLKKGFEATWHTKVLMDGRDTGFEREFDAYILGNMHSADFPGLKVAVVKRPENKMVHFRHALQNNGIDCEYFSVYEEAVDWLRA